MGDWTLQYAKSLLIQHFIDINIFKILLSILIFSKRILLIFILALALANFIFWLFQKLHFHTPKTKMWVDYYKPTIPFHFRFELNSILEWFCDDLVMYQKCHQAPNSLVLCGVWPMLGKKHDVGWLGWPDSRLSTQPALPGPQCKECCNNQMYPENPCQNLDKENQWEKARMSKERRNWIQLLQCNKLVE